MSGDNWQGAASPDIAAMRYDANKKSVPVSYLLWFFVGFLGAHRFYLGSTGSTGSTGSAVAMLVISLVSFLLLFVGVGLIGMALIWIWVLVDAFLIPGMVRVQNNNLITALTQ